MSLDWDEFKRRRPGRDLARVGDGLAAWLADRHPERGRVYVGPLSRPASGHSGETILVDVTWTDHGAERAQPLVVRLPPEDQGLFPRHDLAAQARVQQLLGPTAVPVPDSVVFEPDDGWIGVPFMVMARVPGRALLSRPSYLREGWLHDATPADQARLHGAFVDVLAGLHRLDVDQLGGDFLVRPGGPGIGAEVAWWDEYLHWASDGQPPTDLAEAMAWCRRHVPEAEPPWSLLWGDVQFVNAVFDDAFRPAALLDWEMASIGPAELDLGWFLAFHRLKAVRDGGDLIGFPPREQTLERYTRRLGRDLLDLRWFEAFALVRTAAIKVRGRRLLGAPVGPRPVGDDPAMVLLAELITGAGTA